MEAPQPAKLATEIERIVLDRIAKNKLVVPSMPTVATKCLAILKEPDFALKRLASQLETDPVLVALVLRHANAAANGAAIKLIDQAIGRLGAQRMKTLVVEYSTHQLFRSNDKQIAEANRKIWEHSLGVALLARDLAAFAGNLDGDTCYLGGLLHDVGKPVLAGLLLEAERQLGGGRGGWIDHTAWSAAIANGHRNVGVAVAASWTLPPDVAAAIRDCADYDSNERSCAANVVRLANAIAKREGCAAGPVDLDDVETMIMVGRSMLGIDEDVITRLASGLKARITQTTGA